MDTEIEQEYALAVTHYCRLTGVIEFCLGNKKHFHLFILGKTYTLKELAISVLLWLRVP